MIDLELISSFSTAWMEGKTAGCIANGWDLYGGLIPNGDALGQWIVKTPSDNEYRLVAEVLFLELAQTCKSLHADGFDLFMGTVSWNGRLLQWMQRSKANLLVADAVDVDAFSYKPE